MRLLEEAGMPPGVVNLLTGDGRDVSEVLLADRALAGIHFTGSTATFQHLWQQVGRNIGQYASYPRLVGETGGKDFVVAHPSADVDVLRTALVRGAFEYQGQKCSAASRAYVPRSLWSRLRDDLASQTDALSMGDVTDFGNFMGAVIDKRAFDKLVAAQQVAHDELEVIAGGTADDSVGWFVRPTVVVGGDPGHAMFSTEYFGPILTVHVYDDGDFDTVLGKVDSGAPYGLTGAIIAQDRTAVLKASEALRFAAGNLYINDKPTGAVVGQQPFGGGRTSGTNDKAGSIYNLLRWISPARSRRPSCHPPPSPTPTRAEFRRERTCRDPQGLLITTASFSTGQGLGRHWLARSLRAACSAVSAMRRARVSGRRACTIHSRRARRAEGGNASQFSRAPGWASRAAARSSGTSRSSTASSSVHDPSALAASMSASPAGSISPAASSRSMRCLFDRDHPLRGLRRANHSILRSSSSARPVLSIHPKHSACSTDSA
jgi:delta 1-pyrroline-5-carboxylate dehydrogenase